MVHWRMRGKPEAAEPWFERVRKMDPTNGAVLRFFREHLRPEGRDGGRLKAIVPR